MVELKHLVTLWIAFSSIFCAGSRRPNVSNSEVGKTWENGKTGSFLWMIETEPPSYFFGTIHVPYSRVWDAIPANVKIAFSMAEKVYFELDLTSPATLSSLSACQLLPEGQHLSQIIPSELYHRIRAHLEYVRRGMASWLTQDQLDKGIQADYLFAAITANWERKQPIWVVLMVNSLTKSDIASRGLPVLDLHLSQLAERQSKTVGAIERVHEQCEPFNSLNRSQEIFALNQTLVHAENVKLGMGEASFSTDQLIRLYRRGNLDSFYFSQDAAFFPSLSRRARKHSSNNPDRVKVLADELDAYFKEVMIVQRNKRMAARVIDLLVNDPGVLYFFAFGAGHFIGNNSVLDIVRSAGFSIKQVLPDQLLPAERRWLSTASSNNTVVRGTFDDLSQDEKTKAFLTFLQYHQQLERQRERPTDRFRVLWNNSNSVPKGDDGEMLGESLKVWYGLGGGALRLSPFPFAILFAAALLTFSSC